MTRHLTNAIVARLKAQVGGAVTVYDGGIAPTVTPRMPYVVVYPDSGPMSRERLPAVTSVTRLGVQITSVAGSREAAQITSQDAGDALRDWRPTVPGLDCTTVQQDDTFTAPIRLDQAVQPPAFYAIDRYAVTAVPA